MMTVPETTREGLDVSWDGDVAHVVFDRPGESVNKLDERSIEAFDAILSDFEGRDRLEGVIFSSGKSDSFIAGADVDVLRTLSSPEEARRLSRRAQGVLDRLRGLKAPSVAAIHGAAMGAGLELALACRYRVVTDDQSTRLALPEVKLGLCPGAGGTQYLPRLIGLQRALPYLVTGKTIYPSQAVRLGLADAMRSRPLLMQAANGLLRMGSTGRPSLPLSQRMLHSVAPLRGVFLQQALRRVKAETRDHYPAPLRIIEVVRTGFDEGLERGLADESEAFGELLITPECRSLVSLFVAGRRGGGDGATSRDHSIRTVGVLGAGLMGSGIGDLCAASGLNVVVKDRDLALSSQAVVAARKSADKLLSRHAISPFEAERRVARIYPTSVYSSLKNADLVIEAVPEDVELKHRVLEDVEQNVPEHCIIASNTSAIPLDVLRKPLARPERLVGMHYFSPVAKMPLLEIVRHRDTPKEVLEATCAVGARQGKTVIVVNDGPGFYTTRVLALFLNEALLLLQEGARVEVIDGAVRRFGFAMGPFEVFDLVGVDTAAKIAHVLEPAFADRDVPISYLSSTLAAEGSTGSKAGRGFYSYESRGGGKTARRGASRDAAIRAAAGLAPPRPQKEEDLLERLLMLFVNEAVRCFEEHVLVSPADGDLGAVLGLGFPPYTGGPFQYADRETAQALVLRLERLKLAHGARYESAPLLREMAATGATFYGGKQEG